MWVSFTGPSKFKKISDTNKMKKYVFKPLLALFLLSFGSITLAEPFLSVTSISVFPTAVEPGVQYTVNVTVGNSGSSSSNSATLFFKLSRNSSISELDPNWGSRVITGLGAGGSGTASITLRSPETNGLYYVGACVEIRIDDATSSFRCSEGVLLSVTEDGTEITIPILDNSDAIIWRNSVNGANTYWDMDGNTRLGRASIPTVGDTRWIIAGIADFDGDQHDDIFFRHTTTGENRVWLMDGSQRLASIQVTTASPEWSITALGDFDGDGDTDIIWRRGNTGENRFWEMSGTTRKASIGVRSVSLDWMVAGSGDFDNDGKADLLWRNTNSGANRVWLMDGAIIASSGSLPTVDTRWDVAGVGDFDNDGMDDLFWRHSTAGSNSVWLLAGITRTDRASLPTVGLTWQIAAIGDMDGDNNADVVFRNTSDGQNRLWTMSGLIRLESLAITGVTDQNWMIAGIGNFSTARDQLGNVDAPPAETPPVVVLGDPEFQLIWTYAGGGEGPDLDLIVIDPLGQTLGPSQPGGFGPTPQGGQIDVDDRGQFGLGDGGGPERAFWPAGSSPAGSYCYGLRYWSGDVLVEASVLVYVNGILREFRDATLNGAGDDMILNCVTL